MTSLAVQYTSLECVAMRKEPSIRLPTAIGFATTKLPRLCLQRITLRMAKTVENFLVIELEIKANIEKHLNGHHIRRITSYPDQLNGCMRASCKRSLFASKSWHRCGVRILEHVGLQLRAYPARHDGPRRHATTIKQLTLPTIMHAVDNPARDPSLPTLEGRLQAG
jgi:hypothetical protein